MLTMLSAGCSAVSLKYMAVSRLDTAAGKIPGAGMAAAEVRKGIRTGLESYAQDPEVTLQENKRLLEQKAKREEYAKVRITYCFGSRTEVVDGGMICSWLAEDGTGAVTIDRTKVAAYVKGLAKKYNTAYCTKELKTSYGPTVKITQGHYGWLMDQKTETDNLMRMIESGQSQEREPAYLQTAASHDGPDYGDTYVEMNLTAQHLFYFKDGKLLVESDFVSGNKAKGWSTPAGAYELTYKQKDATLKGANYKTPVTYWMPFNGNIGMHDGYWRTSFGGTIYKKNGSHGCVNLPPAVAKTIFDNIEKGTPVLCYHLEGTETDKTTKDASGKAGISNGKEEETGTARPGAAGPAETAPSAADPAETASSAAAPAETVPSAAAPAETVPSAADPAETAPSAAIPAETFPAAAPPEASSAAPGNGGGQTQAAESVPVEVFPSDSIPTPEQETGAAGMAPETEVMQLGPGEDAGQIIIPIPPA